LRRQLHAAVGETLEPDLGRDADADPAVLSLHFSLARDHGRAWKYARLGAERATARFAHADATQLYRRSIESGRRNGASPAELAGIWEALGNALHKTGELTAAAEAVTIARRLNAGDALAHGRLFYSHMLIAEHAARLTTAVRWGHRCLRMLDGLERREAVVWRARTLARLAFYRVRQGRLLEAERLCHRAIAAARSVGELEAEAYAYYMLDFALIEDGRPEEAVYSGLALEIYDQLGDLAQKGSVLNNLGCFAMDQSRWDEALPLLRESADCSKRAGMHGEVAIAESNIGEIMFDRGSYHEAQVHLNRARRLWTSTGDLCGTAYATVMLGRLAIREGRDLDGFALLHEGIAALHTLGEQGYAELAESWLAEANALAGDARRALEMSEALISLSERMLPLLHRVRAISLTRLGRDEASDEVAIALTVARERGTPFDLAAALDLAETLTWPDPERARERDDICERLGIERLPTPPLRASAVLVTPSAATA
jgi:tetratricopeptide (TPR) repeat protein